MQFDIIGDVHGCYDELMELIDKLGYEYKRGSYDHPDGRLLAFVGDLTDRGPHSLEVIRLVSHMVKKKTAYYVPGNHCNKLYRYMIGRKVQVKHGLETTVAELNALSEEERIEVIAQFKELYEQAPLYHSFPEDELVITHAGIREDDIGSYGKRVETFVLYGDITGETNPDGTPVRRDWAATYQGDWWIVYGHTPVRRPRIIHRTVNIDTGCVFGGALTALRFPEIEFVSIPSRQPLVSEKFRNFPS
ncbi:bis(5'-nucleosyl)-tetraphosphatase PrpE [Halalkalibacterium halodurans]|uniref:bis(5'-nucleosyl)-tetraphosphatase PrpE n=1 Tax=Halalkalibacterium halodurans TaxID=86665 RepID=UPI0010679872|nr:bis(5'-nucleosyl)-tetraphosphatase PrpE [Halalkalibacterium halodurans]TES54767.1 bis(5'-nucleosyl)-tetraphosphatase PrpE [Halalkalibacterium halodurans]